MFPRPGRQVCISLYHARSFRATTSTTSGFYTHVTASFEVLHIIDVQHSCRSHHAPPLAPVPTYSLSAPQAACDVVRSCCLAPECRVVLTQSGFFVDIVGQVRCAFRWQGSCSIFSRRVYSVFVHHNRLSLGDHTRSRDSSYVFCTVVIQYSILYQFTNAGGPGGGVQDSA